MYNKSSGIPSFNKNAVLQLIGFSGVIYIIYHLIRVVMLMANMDMADFSQNVTSNLGLPVVGAFFPRIWTVITYGWIHLGFWEMFSNMVWLYAFGSIVQMLVGYKQVIPMFLYCLIVGGIFYELAQLIPVASFTGRSVLFGAQAGVLGLAVASLTLSPNYRYYLTEHFSIPLVVIVIIFCGLAIINSNLESSVLVMLAGGAGMGFVYVKLLQGGYYPGAWMYNLYEAVGNSAEPNKGKKTKTGKKGGVLSSNYRPQRGVSKDTIDEILDKMNQKGYDSLTREEKESLFKASKEDDK